jgi:hypothetical protein
MGSVASRQRAAGGQANRSLASHAGHVHSCLISSASGPLPGHARTNPLGPIGPKSSSPYLRPAFDHVSRALGIQPELTAVQCTIIVDTAAHSLLRVRFI